MEGADWNRWGMKMKGREGQEEGMGNSLMQRERERERERERGGELDVEWGSKREEDRDDVPEADSSADLEVNPISEIGVYGSCVLW